VTRARTPLAGVAGVAFVAFAGQRLRRHRAHLAHRAAAAEVRADAVDDALTDPRAATDPAQPFLAVVMAAYNEAGSVGPVLGTLPATVCGLPVRPVVIDDGSSDETRAEARAAGALVGTHRHNLGQGDALRSGFALAGRLGARVVVTMDADGQHRPDELPNLVQPVLADEADYVQGSRYLGAYDDAGGARDAGIRVFTAIINGVSGAGITDCTNGYRAIRGDALGRLRLEEPRFSASEIIIESARRGLRMQEVSVHIQSREFGESKKPRRLAYPIGYLGAIVRTWRRG